MAFTAERFSWHSAVKRLALQEQWRELHVLFQRFFFRRGNESDNDSIVTARCKMHQNNADKRVMTGFTE